jgi:hypothetical protein
MRRQSNALLPWIRRPQLSHVHSVLLGCLLALCVGRADIVRASEFIIEWSAPPQCPDRSSLIALVESALADRPRANLTATAVVTHATGGFEARVSITSAVGLGTRMLESKSCKTLTDDVALVIALSASQAVDTSYGRERALPSEHDEIALALGAHASAVSGPLPRPAMGGGVSVAVEGLAALRLELSGTYYASEAATYAQQPSIGAKLSLLRASARVCRIWGVGVLDLGACVSGQLYRLSGVGFGASVIARRGVALLWGPALSVLGRMRLLDRLSLIVAADGVAQLSRDRFVFAVYGPLHQPAGFVLQLFVAAEVRL